MASFENTAPALSRLLSHLHKAPVPPFQGQGWHFSWNILLSPVPHLKLSPPTPWKHPEAPQRESAYFLSKPRYTAVPELVKGKDLRMLWNFSNP